MKKKVKNRANYSNMTEQEFTQHCILSSQKRYRKQRRNRNITVWLCTSGIIYWLIHIEALSGASKNPDFFARVSSDIGLSLLFGFITCLAGFFMIAFINTKCFNLDYDKAELFKTAQQYIEKYGYDEFYYDHIMKESDLY